MVERVSFRGEEEEQERVPEVVVLLVQTRGRMV
jgi:hypothetical protein